MAQLKDLLLESCNIMADYAKKCKNDFVASRCDWYHAAWQYLRALDCVSAPQWHEAFYNKALNEAIPNKQKKVRILISGTADYSLLHLVVTFLTKRNIAAEIVIIDLCLTPLKICDWYAQNCHKLGIPSNYKPTDLSNGKTNVKTVQINEQILLKTICQDITYYSPDRDKNGNKEEYDIICADALLTRFTRNAAKSVTKKWEELLAKNGKIITTVRVSTDVNVEKPQQTLCQLSIEINKYCAKVLERFDGLSADERNKLNISSEDLQFMAFRYIERMKSNRLGTLNQIKEIFEYANLKIIDLGDKQPYRVEGEIDETFYYQIFAEKK